MEWFKVLWEVIKTGWDVLKTVGPFVASQVRSRHGQWPKLVRRGAESIGTPMEEIEALLQAFDNEAFFVAKSRHPIIDDIRRAIWQIHHRLDELRLLALAEQAESVQERCWAVNQIGQRAGAYALPILRSVAESLNTPPEVKETAQRAIREISSRCSDQEGISNESIESDKQ